MTLSPASRPIVATLPSVLVLPPPPVQTRFVSDQPATAASVTVFVPSWAPVIGKVDLARQGPVGVVIEVEVGGDAGAGAVEVEVLGVVGDGVLDRS